MLTEKSRQEVTESLRQNDETTSLFLKGNFYNIYLQCIRYSNDNYLLFSESRSLCHLFKTILAQADKVVTDRI